MSDEDDNNYELCDAATEGDFDEVVRLVQLCDARWGYNAALRDAAENGHAQCVEVLIPHSTPKENDSWALREACENGHFECVKLLLPHSDPNDFCVALENAAREGCAKSVDLILPQVSNVVALTSALEIAAINGHYDCVEVLYPHANVGRALNNLHEYYSRYKDNWSGLQDRFDAEQQKIVLEQVVDTPLPPSRLKKM